MIDQFSMFSGMIQNLSTKLTDLESNFSMIKMTQTQIQKDITSSQVS